MKPPCEVVSKYVLPKIRAMVAKELVETHGLTQMEAASKLGMTQAAVSYYITSKRGYKVSEFEGIPVIKTGIGEIANLLVEEASTLSVLKRICTLCYTLRTSAILCELCRVSSQITDLECSGCEDLIKEFSKMHPSPSE